MANDSGKGKNKIGMKKIELFIVILTISIVVCIVPLVQRIYVDLQRNKVTMGVDESFFNLSSDKEKVIKGLRGVHISLIFTSTPNRDYNGFQVGYCFDLNKGFKIPKKKVDLITVVGENKMGKDIESIKRYISANGKIPVGFVEFDPSTTFGRKLVMMRGNGFRIHRIKKREMEKMGKKMIDIMITRYRRAALERNVNVLWIYPIPIASLRENLRFLGDIQDSIKRSGISIRERLSLPYVPDVRAKYQYFFLFSLLSFAIIILIEGLGIELNVSKEYLFFAVLLGFFIISYILNSMFTLEVSAIIDAVVFSSIVYIYSIMEKKDRERKEALTLYLLTFLFAFIGGLFIQVLLFDTRYINGALIFRGVKIALVFPIVLIAIRYLENRYFIRYLSPKKLDILILVLLGIAAVLYVTRSGNHPLIPPFTFERRLRDWLDRTLFVRPRFKEILIGYPLLWLGLRNKITWLKRYTPLILLFSSVGPISTMNTFCHIQTPILFSILRSLYGVGLGLIIGIILERILKGIPVRN